MANTYRPRSWWLCRSCGNLQKSARWKKCRKCHCYPHALIAGGMMAKTAVKARAFAAVTGPAYYESVGLSWESRRMVR